MDVWQELFGRIGWWIVPLMIVTWVVRELWDVRKGVSQARLTHLAEQRAESIQAFYQALVRTQQQHEDLYYRYMPVGIAPARVEPREAVEEMRRLQEMSEAQRLFFEPKLCALIDGMCARLAEVTQALEHRDSSSSLVAGALRKKVR